MIATHIFSNIRKYNQLRHSPKSYDSETCHAALRTQSLQRVYNLDSLGGLDLL